MMRRAALPIVLPLLAALALAGCGFSPMYARSGGVASTLSGIAVETSEGREAYLLGVAMRDRLGSWDGERARYTLMTQTSVTRAGTALTLDQVASRVLLGLNVSYALYDRETGALMTQGSIVGQATYDVPAEPYAAIRAEQDSTERAAASAADRLTADLARYFAAQRQVAAAAP